MSVQFPRYDFIGCSIIEPPANLTNIALLPFQVEGYSWMVAQEEWRGGGILADDMGMGKTIQSIALVLKRRGSTLVVTPASLTDQWMQALRKHAPTLRSIVYHGQSKVTVEAIESCDVCITSYDTLASFLPASECSSCRKIMTWKEFSAHDCYRRYKQMLRTSLRMRKQIPKLQSSGFAPNVKCLLNITFDRVILDECHMIKRASTRRARACGMVLAKNRWCLSGTPFQNKLGEFANLLRFLGYNLGTFCTCKSLPCDYKCLNDKIRKDDPRQGNRFEFLEQIFEDLVLRRLKEDHLVLPSIVYEDVHFELTQREREAYDTLYRWFYSAVNQNGPDRYLEYILRLRQSVVSAELLNRMNENVICSVCLSIFQKTDQIDLFDCGHFCHSHCAGAVSDRIWCPECLGFESGCTILPPRLTFDFDCSSKVDAIVSELLSVYHSKEKTLVFTCFKELGPRICRALGSSSLRCGVIDGDVSDKRRQMLYSDLDVGLLDVLVFTLGCGSVGLNLQAVNRVIIACP